MCLSLMVYTNLWRSNTLPVHALSLPNPMAKCINHTCNREAEFKVMVGGDSTPFCKEHLERFQDRIKSLKSWQAQKKANNDGKRKGFYR